MFQAMVTTLHSPRTWSIPRSRNRRKPMADLMMAEHRFRHLLAQSIELRAFLRVQPVGHRLERCGILRSRRRIGEAFAQGGMTRQPSHGDERRDLRPIAAVTLAALKYPLSASN